MAAAGFWFFSAAFTIVVAQTSLDESLGVRQHKCGKGDKMINDCNWCRCRHNRYKCEARDCATVDMFGHFNDAIKDIDVGMEGHGVWRSTSTACEPNVHYLRGSMLCVCNDDGFWPNPACRDIFRVLHQVETTEDTSCSPMKLYLQECNVCFCPSTGHINQTLCTQKVCPKQDPVISKKSEPETEEVEDVYAECSVDLKYRLGCQTCTCLRNNRLLCGNCTKTNEEEHHHCKGKKPNTVFDVDCNLCFCDTEGRMVCSAKRCLGTVAPATRRLLMDIDERYFELVERPITFHICKVGTKYRKGCNTCICLEFEGKPMFACSVRPCKETESLVRRIREGCVLKTTYEMNCLRCSCVMANHEKWQWCKTDNICSDAKSESKELSTLNGYCEPLHSYTNDCNTCQCLMDGQLVICSDLKCDKGAIAVEIVPVLKSGYDCPRGHAYKSECNICYCLLNGNSLCTTLDCKKP